MTSITTLSCFSIFGIALFSASMRGWRCSAMRMVGVDAAESAPAREPVPEREQEMRTAAAAAHAISPTPARSTVIFIGLPAAIGIAAESLYAEGVAGQFFSPHSVSIARNGRVVLMLRLGIIGAGLEAAEYARGGTAMPDVEISALAETDPASRRRLSDICAAAGRPRPAEYATDRAMLQAEAGRLDAVYVATPHVFHAANALAVIDAGLDLLLEKPMVTTVEEALALADAEKRSARTIVIAFQSGLSPLIHDTGARARRGEFGDLVSVSASIWEGWAKSYAGHWKQKPSISSGGFMFDTGAHMMNTVCILADAEFVRLSAFTNNRGLEVDLVCAVAARLSNGALVTFNAAGDGPPGCASAITLFYTNAIVRIDAWGGWREVAIGGGAAIREVSEIVDTPMHTFRAVREGRMPNPSTVANGLRFARLWDAIKASAAGDGQLIE